MNLSKSAGIVQIALKEKGLEFKVVELSESTRTANDAASTIGCEIGQIVKSLLFQTKESKKPILLLVSGKNKVNEKAIQNLVGEKITKANADFVREITGFAIGGIPPLGHKNPMTFIYIDEDLLHYDTVWAAAGTPNAVFSFPAKELEKTTGGKIISVIKEV